MGIVQTVAWITIASLQSSYAKPSEITSWWCETNKVRNGAGSLWWQPEMSHYSAPELRGVVNCDVSTCYIALCHVFSIRICLPCHIRKYVHRIFSRSGCWARWPDERNKEHSDALTSTLKSAWIPLLVTLCCDWVVTLAVDVMHVYASLFIYFLLIKPVSQSSFKYFQSQMSLFHFCDHKTQ